MTVLISQEEAKFYSQKYGSVFINKIFMHIAALASVKNLKFESRGFLDLMYKKLSKLYTYNHLKINYFGVC